MPKFCPFPTFCFALSALFQPAHAFDLAQAWQAALHYSADHAAAKHSRDAEAEQKYQARAALLPQISANAVYQKQPYSLSANTQSHGWNVQASQILYDKSRFAQYRQGRLAAQMADIRLENHADDVRLNVAQAYFDVLLNRDKLAAIRDEKNAYRQQIRQAQAMFAQGAATIIDTYEAQAGYSEMQEKVIQRVDWVAKPNVSDGLWICWVFNPTYPLYHFFYVFHYILFFRMGMNCAK